MSQVDNGGNLQKDPECLTQPRGVGHPETNVNETAQLGKNIDRGVIRPLRNFCRYVKQEETYIYELCITCNLFTHNFLFSYLISYNIIDTALYYDVILYHPHDLIPRLKRF